MLVPEIINCRELFTDLAIVVPFGFCHLQLDVENFRPFPAKVAAYVPRLA